MSFIAFVDKKSLSFKAQLALFFETDFKTRFNSDDDLLLRKALDLHDIVIVLRSVFYDVDKYYPYVFLNDCLYKLTEYVYMLVFDDIDVSEVMNIKKTRTFSKLILAISH